MKLTDSIVTLPKTRPLTIQKLNSLGVYTYIDLLNYYPSRYEDRGHGDKITVKGILLSLKNLYTKRGFKIQKALLEDETGQIELVWYNQLYLLRFLKKGMYLSVYGSIEISQGKRVLQVEDYDILLNQSSDTIHTGRIVPIYSETSGLSSRTIREKVWLLLQQLKLTSTPIDETLPLEIVNYNQLISSDSAYTQIHFPDNNASLERAKDRLGFDELFFLQLSSTVIKNQWKKEKVERQLRLDESSRNKYDGFIKKLPFNLTGSQEKVIGEIVSDMLAGNPMNRLLQGDVGSGKTVVSAIASYLAFLNKYKSLIMAPTEILAQQHFITFCSLFSSYKNVNIKLITGSHKLSTKDLKKIDILIGTQALLNDKVLPKDVGLVVIDEQHRFGVRQRAQLQEKGMSPHLLTMTATPIPRTVSLTLYGELDISLIDELPKGRKPIKTYFVPRAKRKAAYEWINNLIVKQRLQAYIVCPFIDESEHETLKSLKAATKEFDRLKNEEFKDLSLGLLHGRLKSRVKEAVMNDFKNKKYDILVTTSVVEVGVDVANAGIMIIEGSERFGLAQLHQLRGRVGRGSEQSYCLVFSEQENAQISKRLQYFCSTSNGMQLAEYDLKLRGPGSIYGTSQHGYSDLRIASLFDYPLIQKVQKAVQYLMNREPNLNKYPLLQKKLQSLHSEEIAKN